MKIELIQFSRMYHERLRAYLSKNTKLKSTRALGEQAASLGLEILDLAALHELALRKVLFSARNAKNSNAVAKKASFFFAAAIYPLEFAHRGARETGIRLRHLSNALERRTTELASSNQELKKEIARRAGIERALRKSERHYAQLLQESARLQEQLRNLSHQILSAQEEERKKISRELHDQIAATLTGINIELNALKYEVTANNKALQRKIGNTQQLIQNSVEVIHDFARELRPATLDDLGLIPALHSFTKSLSKQTGIRINLTVFGAVEQLENEKRTVIYRVTQEALTNVARHAHANKVEVDIGKLDNAVTLRVSDDGKSFRVARSLHGKRNKRLGVLGMRERVEMVGGTFKIESSPGSGTTVSALIPITPAEQAKSALKGRPSKPS
jgi:signal transduction histidine kinase